MAMARGGKKLVEGGKISVTARSFGCFTFVMAADWQADAQRDAATLPFSACAQHVCVCVCLYVFA